MNTTSHSGTPATETRPPLVISDVDAERLRALVSKIRTGPLLDAAERLEQELDRARIVPASEIPADVVTMRSRVVYQDLASGKQREATPVYPSEADPSKGRISVLAPVGSALIGLRVGQPIQWPTPSGDATIVVLAVSYQPEASGDADL